MAQTIKRPFRSFNGTDWDKHYFETSADQVKMNDGTNVEAKVTQHLAEKATQDGYGHIRLQDIPNPEIATQIEAEAGTNNTKMMTPLRTQQAFDNKIQVSGSRVNINIAGKMVTFKREFDLNSWSDVQQIVRDGYASDYFNVGDQLVSAYDGGEIVWEVIGIDVDTPVDSNFSHSMTLQTKDCLHDIQFDAPEPTNPHSDRKNYGNNRYIHSAVRQWLNSDEEAFNWQSQHQYDAKPTDSLDLYNGAGFLRRLDPELVSVIGLVNKRVARNTAVDGGGQDNFTDKVFLLSQKEVGLGTEGDIAGEFVYPFYDGISNAGRIKQLNGSDRGWWLRSPFVSYSYDVRYVYTDGSLNKYGALYTRGVSPACVII